MFMIASVALALHVGAPAPSLNEGGRPLVQEIQYRVPVRPPPCGHGWDLSARDGMCYPNGYLPPQEMDAYRRGYHRGGGYHHGGRHPVPCGHGADVDTRDGLCYPNGTVPLQFQQGRQGYYGDGYHEPRPRRRHYNY
jgi:hypothetical protein